MTYLDLSGMPVGAMGKRDVDKVTGKWNTYDRVRNEMAKIGFRELDPPSDLKVPTLSPGDLENVQDNAYTSLYTRFVAWLSFGESHMGVLSAERREIRTAMRVLAAEIRKKAKSDFAATRGPAGKAKSIDKTELSDLVLTDSSYQALLLRDQETSQKMEIIEHLLKGISRNVQLMSRNIEMKRLELQFTGQGGNLQRRLTGTRPGEGRGGSTMPTFVPSRMRQDQRKPQEKPEEEDDDEDGDGEQQIHSDAAGDIDLGIDYSDGAYR